MVDLVDIAIPDIGDAGEVKVIEIVARVGDVLDVDDTLLTVESDKSSMDIPVVQAGTVAELLVSVGDRISTAQVVARLQPVTPREVEVEAGSQSPGDGYRNSETAPAPIPSVGRIERSAPGGNQLTTAITTHTGGNTENVPSNRTPSGATGTIYKAGPAARRLARELGVDIAHVNGSGRSGRITKQDIKAHTKNILAGGVTRPGGRSVAPLPDLSRFGPVHTQSLGNIERATSRNMQRSWEQIPHAWVTSGIDITELESARQSLKNRVDGLTTTAMVVRAMAILLVEFPRFNCAINPEEQQLIQREYVHVGVAVDTPKGLVVAVIRNADALSLTDTSAQLRYLSERARQGNLVPAEMQGASMTLSNLGGMGVRSLQPVVNWPEVAILGVGAGRRTPAFIADEVVAKLEMSCTLGFDHRVINGADGARYLGRLGELLGDPFSLIAVV